MTEAARVELTVLGETLVLRSAESPKYLRSLVSDLEERVAVLQRGGVRDVRQALLMAALEMADELRRGREERAQQDREVRTRLAGVLAELERATRGSETT